MKRRPTIAGGPTSRASGRPAARKVDRPPPVCTTITIVDQEVRVAFHIDRGRLVVTRGRAR